MGVREYGRHRGVSHVAVLKALRSGRIRQTADGLIDSDSADRDWSRNTHPFPRAPRAVPHANGADDFGFSRARTVREHYEALLARLEFEQRSASLLRGDEVKIAALQTQRAFTEHMLRLPAALAPQVAAEHDDRRVHVILSAAIRDALTAFADQRATLDE